MQYLLYMVAGAWLLWLNSWKAHARSRHWRSAAEAAGLTHLREAYDLEANTMMTGRCGSLEVELGWDADMGKSVAYATVRGLLSGLVLRAQAVGAASRADTTTGDEAFDRAFEVHGPDAALRAVLDARTRALVQRVMGASQRPAITIAKGELRLEVPAGGTRESLASGLRAALDLAPRLVRPDDVPAGLARNARGDPQAGVRLRCLQALIREFPDHPATRDALAAVRDDRSDEVRLGVGLALGPAGLDFVREIIQAEDPDDGCAARAVVALGSDLPVTRALEMLRHALRRRRLRTAEACLVWLGWHGGADAVEPLAKVLAIEHGDLAVAAARALGAGGLPAAEPSLIHALASAIAGVRVAAAEGLESLGSAAAVWPLKEAAARHPGDFALRRAARQAIAAIQSRLTGTPGQLSLAGGEAGQLALTEEEDPAGQLSLAPPAARKTDG
jgi:hypothetical protein